MDAAKPGGCHRCCLRLTQHIELLAAAASAGNARRGVERQTAQFHGCRRS